MRSRKKHITRTRTPVNHRLRSKKSVHKRRLRGGKAFASGDGGCVFRPALKCEGETEQPMGQLSKLAFKNNSEGEWRALSFVHAAIAVATVENRYNDVHNVTLYHSPTNYFILPTQSCTPALLETTDLEEFDKVCQQSLQHINSTNVNDNRKLQLGILQMLDGGPTLHDRAKRRAPPIASEPFWNAMLGLLANGIVPLNRQSVLHHDIKFNNVVYNENDSLPYVRLIDWDRAIQLDTFDNLVLVLERNHSFRSAMQQPIAYAFMCTPVCNVFNQKDQKGLETEIKEKDEIKDEIHWELLQMASRLHDTYETRAEKYAGCSERPERNVYLQIGAVLDKFYDESTRKFNWRAYRSLMLANYDVYGWLALVNYCAQRYTLIFSDHELYDFYTGQELKRFLLKYMYSPTLLEPYNLSELSLEFNTIVISQFSRSRRMFVGPGY